jgi:tetratricopeptide (TPR) repeat protein
MRARPMRSIAIIVLAAACAAAAHAITFAPATKPDPFAAGKTCDTPQLASYGSYVYSWPSKYDLIFSPTDYPMWIWRCPASGYVAFPGDFEKVTDSERPKIASYLDGAKFGPKVKDSGISDELLEHLEKVYALRDKDEKFRAYFMRYLAWQYREKPIADDYRRKAFDIHLKMLKSGALKGEELADTLYILGFYAYKFGRIDEAKAYFDQLKEVETIDPETKKPRRGIPYLNQLAQDVLAGKADDKVRFSKDAN